MTWVKNEAYESRYSANWSQLSRDVKRSQQINGDLVRCAGCMKDFSWSGVEAHHTYYLGDGDTAGLNLFALCGTTSTPGTCHHWVHLKDQWTHDQTDPVWRSGNHQNVINSLQANYRSIVGQSSEWKIPVFKAPIETTQYAPKYYPQSPQPDFRSLDRDPHFPWLGLIVAGAIAVWVGGFIKVNPTAPKTWKMPNGPSITLSSIPDIKIPKLNLPKFDLPSIDPTPQTIVVKRRANVRSAPNGKILCQVETNEQLKAIGSSDSWTKVKACGGDGFIHNSLVNKGNTK